MDTTVQIFTMLILYCTGPGGGTHLPMVYNEFSQKSKCMRRLVSCYKDESKLTLASPSEKAKQCMFDDLEGK